MTKLLKFICSRYSHVFSENKRTEKAAGSTVGKHGLITDNTDWVMDSCSKKKNTPRKMWRGKAEIRYETFGGWEMK